MSFDSTFASTPKPQNAPHANQEEKPAITLLELFREYARENPGVVAACCFGMGFALGWKLKPW